MRITFVIPDIGFGGGNRVVAIYADRLKRRGHEVTVVSGHPAKITLFDKLRSKLRGRGWPNEIGLAQPYFEELGIPVHVLDSRRPVSDKDVPDGDVVIATWWETAEWVNDLSEAKGAKAYFIQHHEIFSYLPADRSRATYYLPFKKIVISRWLVETMSDIYGDRKASLVYNSVDTAQFYAPSRDKQSIPTIGFLYATVDFKGPDILAASLKILKHQLPSLKAIAFGAEQVSGAFPLPGWVEFHYRPPQQDIRFLYGRCDVWMCGSRSEGFHLPPLEAMACRCPVVTTRVGGPLDIVREGENGFLVDVNDAVGLASRTLEVLQMNNASWQTMSTAAELTARGYTWDAATELFEAALIEAVERRF